MRTLVLALTSLLAAAGPATAAGSPAVADVREGDLVFHISRSAQSLAIQRATGSPYSHMGLVLFRGGKPFVFEAVATVRHTPFGAWIRRGDKGRYVVKRLADAAILTHLRSDLRVVRRPYLLLGAGLEGLPAGAGARARHAAEAGIPQTRRARREE